MKAQHLTEGFSAVLRYNIIEERAFGDLLDKLAVANARKYFLLHLLLTSQSLRAGLSDAHFSAD